MLFILTDVVIIYFNYIHFFLFLDPYLQNLVGTLFVLAEIMKFKLEFSTQRKKNVHFFKQRLFISIGCSFFWSTA